jgi:hypothetical protein
LKIPVSVVQIRPGHHISANWQTSCQPILLLLQLLVPVSRRGGHVEGCDDDIVCSPPSAVTPGKDTILAVRDLAPN